MDGKKRAAMVGFFVRRHLGLYVTDDGSLGPNPAGAQCVNWPNLWCEHLGIELLPGDAGTFIYDNHPDCDWVANEPMNCPERGAIVVWGESALLPFGHVDVCVWSTVYELCGSDQNWPEGSPVHIQMHNYSGVAGWLMPRKLM